MKKIILIICVTISPIISNAQEKININVSKSTIKWMGEYTFYFGGHEGNINFTEGFLLKTKDTISGGEFIIDMDTLESTDIKKKEAKLNLENHLKDPDFFNVKKYPLAKLKITRIKYTDKTHARMQAELTLKDMKKTIDFNVEFNYEEKQMTTRFKIDRRAWNVNYTSDLKDGAISDAIGFEVAIKL